MDMEGNDELEGTGLRLSYADAGYGGWAEAAPETVSALKAHLGTGSFAVITCKWQSEGVLWAVIDGFTTQERRAVDDGGHIFITAHYQ